MNDDQRHRLAKLIRLLRGQNSLRDFGRKTGVSYAAIHSYESKDSIPDLDSFQKIAEYKKISLCDLLAYVLDGKVLPSLDHVLKTRQPAKMERQCKKKPCLDQLYLNI